jgi:hypothetical protein
VLKAALCRPLGRFARPERSPAGYQRPDFY